jgi:hypothetical protein
LKCCTPRARTTRRLTRSLGPPDEGHR